MKFADQMIAEIYFIVSNQGALTNKAQSDWGMDTWEMYGVTVGLSDAGYTYHVRWGDRLQCRHTICSVCDKPVFDKGDENDLTTLWKGLTSLAEMV
jgi:hypothetical protein